VAFARSTPGTEVDVLSSLLLSLPLFSSPSAALLALVPARAHPHGVDRVDYELPLGALGALGRFGGAALVRRKLARLFDYRHEVTRRACEDTAHGVDAVNGNPPYIRYQSFSDDARAGARARRAVCPRVCEGRWCAAARASTSVSGAATTPASRILTPSQQGQRLRWHIRRSRPRRRARIGR
jgi:hypothetical protein